MRRLHQDKMAEKVSVEEGKKISIIGYIDKLEKLPVTDDTIDEIRNNLVSQLTTMSIPLGQDIVLMKEVKAEIDDIIEDEVWNDIFDDVVTLSFKNQMKYSRNYDLKKEQIIRAFAEAVIEIIEKITDVVITTKHKIREDDETSMSEEERQYLKNKATRLVLQYKKFKEDPSVNKMKYANAYAYKLYKTSDTEEKFEMINDIFFDITGEYVLTNLRKKNEAEEKKSEKIGET